jgi:RAB6A-GEF complex partner protein 1
MHWPTSIKQTQKLPQTENLRELNKSSEHTYKLDPHNDEIIDLLTNYSNGLPYAVITYRSIYLFDWTHKVPVNAHIRSDESIETYGSNQTIRLSPNQQTFAVMTSKNIILVYTYKINGSDSELLGVYDSSGKIVQNGYPLIVYREDPLGYGGMDSKYESSYNGGNQGIVKNILSSFIGTDGNEVPVVDLGLRLKLILNVASPIVEYCFTSSMELLLINTNPHAFQIIHLNKTNDTKPRNSERAAKSGNPASALEDSGKEINFIIADELDWFVDPEINNSSEIIDMDYNYDLDCFLWINEQGDALLVKNSGDRPANIQLNAKCIYKASSNGDGRALKGLINHFKNTLYLILDSGNILIYKLSDNLSCTLLKNIERCLPSKNPKDLYLHPHGDSVLVHYENGWNIYSLLGNLIFSTFEYDHLKISNCKKIQYLNSNEIILVSAIDEIILLDLTVFNLGEGYSSLSTKRPVLYDNDQIRVFKAYEKKLIEHHHYNYNVNDITNKETDVWLSEMLPINFRINNRCIRSCCTSEDGNNICIVGNYDVIVFSYSTRAWKTLELTQDNTSQFEKSMSVVQKCLWWKNYLILGTCKDNGKVKESEVYIFSERILEKDRTFSVDSLVWNFNFADTPFDDEYFINFNVDTFTDTLFVMTNKINCYTWNLSQNKRAAEKINGDYEVSQLHDTSLKSIKSSILIQKSTVHQLKSCFKETDESIILNYGTILKINDTDLLFLSNTDLYYIRRERVERTFTSAYVIYLVSECVEYVTKLSSTFICLFDGSQLIHYNLSDNTDLLKLKPILISVGNDIVQSRNQNDSNNESDDRSNFNKYLVKYTGVCPYPITTIPFQNVAFGIEIECFNRIKLKLETIRRNYLADLVNHYIMSNIEVKHLEEDSNALNINNVFMKFSKFKQFNFVLEKLMVEYLQLCYDDNEYDTKDDYFDRLYLLIQSTGNEYEIILNCLKKTETHFWPIFFNKADLNPRYVVNKLFTESSNQRLTAHFFIIMLNYEKYDTNNYHTTNINSTKKKKKKSKSKNNGSTISTSDQDIIINVLKRLIVAKDFETSFELVRFLKIVNSAMTHKCLEKLKLYMQND